MTSTGAEGPGGVESPPREARSVSYGKLAIGLIVLVALVYFGRRAGGLVPVFAEWVEGLGVLGPIVFIVGYAVATVAFIPGSVLTLAAGAIFGVAEGTLLVMIAATLGSIGAFLIARYLARSSIEKRIEGDERFAAIDRAIGAEGLKIVFLLRLSPVFPFNLLNYALGLTRVRTFDYSIASIGMLPGTLLYVYAGKVAGDVAAVAGGHGGERGPGDWAVLVLGLLATALVTIFVTRIARRALAAATETEGNSNED